MKDDGEWSGSGGTEAAACVSINAITWERVAAGVMF